MPATSVGSLSQALAPPGLVDVDMLGDQVLPVRLLTLVGDRDTLAGPAGWGADQQRRVTGPPETARSPGRHGTDFSTRGRASVGPQYRALAAFRGRRMAHPCHTLVPGPPWRAPPSRSTLSRGRIGCAYRFSGANRISMTALTKGGGTPRARTTTR